MQDLELANNFGNVTPHLVDFLFGKAEARRTTAKVHFSCRLDQFPLNSHSHIYEVRFLGFPSATIRHLPPISCPRTFGYQDFNVPNSTYPPGLQLQSIARHAVRQTYPRRGVVQAQGNDMWLVQAQRCRQDHARHGRCPLLQSVVSIRPGYLFGSDYIAVKTNDAMQKGTVPAKVVRRLGLEEDVAWERRRLEMD